MVNRKRRRVRHIRSVENLETRQLMASDLCAVEVGSGDISQFPTFFVDSLEDSVDVAPGDGKSADALGRSTLRAAIMEANACGGGQVVLGEGTYTLDETGTGEDLGLRGDLDVWGDIEIVGDEARGTVIDAAGIDRVFHVHSTGKLSLSELTARGGAAGSGAGILNEGSLNISHSTLSHNLAQSAGGGIKNYGTITIDSSTISHNEAEANGSDGGGIFNAEGTVTITNTTISNNKATDVGHAIRNQSLGTVNLVSTTIAENSKSRDRAVWNAGGKVEVTNSIVVGGVGGYSGEHGVYISRGNNLIARSAQLGPLRNNGGSTNTMHYFPIASRSMQAITCLHRWGATSADSPDSKQGVSISVHLNTEPLSL